MSEHRSIIMRSNRLLGAALVEHNLVSVEQLEEANEHLFKAIEGGTVRQMCLMDILMNTVHAFTQERILEHTVDDLTLPLIDLREIDLDDELKISVQTGICWATWTVPFDRDGDVSYLASAYHLSPAVRRYWEKELGGTLIWYGTPLDSVSDFLESLEAERNGTAVGYSPAEKGAA